MSIFSSLNFISRINIGIYSPDVQIIANNIQDSIFPVLIQTFSLHQCLEIRPKTKLIVFLQLNFRDLNLI